MTEWAEFAARAVALGRPATDLVRDLLTLANQAYAAGFAEGAAAQRRAWSRRSA